MFRHPAADPVRAPAQAGAKWVIAYGLSQGVGQFGLLFLSLKVGMSASLASVILQTQVFFTAIFGFMLLKNAPAAR
jgi:O-acetylserine/cysteine efflux transporter